MSDVELFIAFFAPMVALFLFVSYAINSLTNGKEAKRKVKK